MQKSNVLLSLILLLPPALTVEINCRWKDNSIAVNYLPCNPASTRGTCCLEGETCLESGLCYGAVGLIYRGACNNVWDPNTCLTICEDKSANWANIYACPPKGGSNPPIGWWCGKGTEQACSENGTMLRINPGLPSRILGLFAEANATSSTSTISSSTPPAITSSAPSSNPSSSGEPAAVAQPTVSKGAFIGLGAGLGVLLVVIAVGGLWWLRYHRKQQARIEIAGEERMEEYKRELAARHTWMGGNQGSGSVQEMDSAKKRAELEEGRKRVVELDGTAYI